MKRKQAWGKVERQGALRSFSTNRTKKERKKKKHMSYLTLFYTLKTEPPQC